MKLSLVGTHRERYVCRMAPIISSLSLAMAAFLLTACGERAAHTTLATQSSSSRAGEYRAGLNAYAAGRYEKAFKHFREAAKRGNANAQYYTGLMYANGEVTKQDYALAAKWYQQAAAHHQPDALVQLARLHVMGLGVEQDAAKAVELFGRAAKIYPPGEQRDQAMAQRKALAEVSGG